MRLNSFLAKAGVTSRRKADELIKGGRVTVNGKPGQLEDSVNEQDDVRLDGRAVRPEISKYILLNKPAGYLTTMKDPHGRRKVTDLIKVDERVVPVGRLDWDTTGALLLTNDGQLANDLMHPRFEVDKVYEAHVEGEVDDKKLNKLSNGIELDGRITAPAKVRRLAANKIELTIHEGRHHQVKKMLSAVDLRVTRLHRTRYGPLNLEGLRAGAWRELSEREVNRLKMLQ